MGDDDLKLVSGLVLRSVSASSCASENCVDANKDPDYTVRFGLKLKSWGIGVGTSSVSSTTLAARLLGGGGTKWGEG